MEELKEKAKPNQKQQLPYDLDPFSVYIFNVRDDCAHPIYVHNLPGIRKQYPNIPNETIFWSLLRKDVLFTSTELVELSGHGYLSSTRYLFQRIFDPLKKNNMNEYGKMLLMRGRLGEKLAIEKFLNVYTGIYIHEPYFTEMEIGLKIIEKEFGSKSYILPKLKIGASVDGYIKDSKTGKNIAFIEVKTFTNLPKKTTELKIHDNSRIPVKYRWLLQMVIQAIVNNLEYGILIIYNFCSQDFYPFLFKIDDNIKRCIENSVIVPSVFNYLKLLEELRKIEDNNTKTNIFKIIRLYFDSDRSQQITNFPSFYDNLHVMPRHYGEITKFANDCFHNINDIKTFYTIIKNGF